ncbi:hypothetical protein C2G38_2149803 [Gigaspora rosea]|uniref:Uncharacterized protein n=1 Tax=Gigaspora rosea TaxID=44941 RepID=A0A397U252_9GLOM|nr:hypothetical protein C2G38_2149803 [Gigaspora rosea]
MVSTKYYRAYVFSTKDSVTWVCKSMIELKYFSEIWIAYTGKLIIFNDAIYEIIISDIEVLSNKTNILIDWNYALKSIEISDDEELLIICAKNEEANEMRFYFFHRNWNKPGILLSEIKMHYYWNNWDGRLKDFDFEKSKFKGLLDLFNSWNSRRILPPSSYETIYKNLDIEFVKKKRIQEMTKKKKGFSKNF